MNIEILCDEHIIGLAIVSHAFGPAKTVCTLSKQRLRHDPAAASPRRCSLPRNFMFAVDLACMASPLRAVHLNKSCMSPRQHAPNPDLQWVVPPGIGGVNLRAARVTACKSGLGKVQQW